MYSCPNCGGRLRGVRDARGWHWMCEVCSGQVVTMPVIRRSLAREVVRSMWNAAHDAPASGPRKCPSCGRAMRQVPAQDRGGAPVLDVCLRCQLVWFDAAELSSLPAARPARKDELSPRAREALAMGRIELVGQRESFDDAGPGEWWQIIPAILGFPVEQEAEPLASRPWAAWLTAAAIAAVSILAIVGGAGVVSDFGLVPAKWWRHGGLTLVSSFLVHGGVIHLVGNLYFLLVFGDNVEDVLGWRLWVALVVLAGLSGDILHIAADPRSTVPVIGASGGISGLLAFYTLMFPGVRLGTYMRFGGSLGYYVKWISLPAWVWFLFWGVFQALGAVLQVKGLSNVSYLAHLGGAAVGFGFWVFCRKGA